MLTKHVQYLNNIVEKNHPHIFQDANEYVPFYQDSPDATIACRRFLTKAGLLPLIIELREQIHKFNTVEDFISMIRAVLPFAGRIEEAEGKEKEMEFMREFVGNVMRLQGKESEPQAE